MPEMARAHSAIQAVFAMNALAWCARESRRNVLSEARDPRRSLRDSMDHVTGVPVQSVVIKPKPKLSMLQAKRGAAGGEAYDFRVP